MRKVGCDFAAAFFVVGVIPHLSRSSLHRCLQRHGISRLPKSDREKPKRFKSYEIGYFHIDIESCDMRAARPSSLSQSIGFRRSSSPGPIARRQSLSQPASSRPWLKRYPTKSTQCSRITASNSCSMTDGQNVGSSITSSARYAQQMISSTVRPSPIIHGPMGRLNAWSERSRTRLLSHSITPRSLTCGDISGTGYSPTTTPNSSKRYDSKHPTKPSANSARKSRKSSFETQAMTCWDQTPRSTLDVWAA